MKKHVEKYSLENATYCIGQLNTLHRATQGTELADASRCICKSATLRF